MNTRTRMSAIVATLGLVGSLALATASADESRTSGSAAQIALTEVARAQNPTAGAAGPQDTVWIAERAGTVRVLGDDGLGEPVLDISDETTTDGERGLLGLAFDERFAHLYLSYTDLEGTSTVDEFAVQDGTVREDTRRTVLTQEQPESNHNGGAITFGPDGYLCEGSGVRGVGVAEPEGDGVGPGGPAVGEFG